MRLTSFTVASGPAAWSAVIVSIVRLPSRPPAALVSSAASVWPLSEGRPRIAPGPDWIVMWPNFTGVSGMRPLGVSCAAALPTTARSPSAAPPSATPSPARKSRRSRSLAMRPSCHGDADCMDAIAAGGRLHTALRVCRAGVQLVPARRGDVPRICERLPLMIGAAWRHARRLPRLAAVGADLHRAHRPGAPRPALDPVPAALQHGTLGRRHDHRVHVQLAHRAHVALDAPVVELRGEHALGTLGRERDAREPLHGVGAEVARHEHARGEAVLRA